MEAGTSPLVVQTSQRHALAKSAARPERRQSAANLYPAQYIEETGELTYYEQLTLQIKTKNSQSINAIRGLQRDKEIVAKLVDNPSDILSYNCTSGLLDENTVNYVIITNEMLANSGLEYNLQYFAQSKIDKGLSADIFTV